MTDEIDIAPREWRDPPAGGGGDGGDIVAQLRQASHNSNDYRWKAADEIERLREALDDERAAHQVCVEMRNDAEAEIVARRSYARLLLSVLSRWKRRSEPARR